MSSRGDGQQLDQGPAGPDPTAAATSGPRRPFAPEPFGKYYLLDRVAVGGMAEVFRAKSFGHSGFEKVVVIKRILERFAEDPEFVEMFIDEAKLSVQLMHPNIGQIYDFGKIDTNFFIAMEAIDGKDLKTLLRRLAERGERMPVAAACCVAHQVARGLDYAHTRSDQMGLPLNIVHRDISPSNVLLSYDGHVKIVDFGIAHADSANSQSEAGVLKGKYSYMSPEQASGLPLDHRSDIFSTGICLWEMLTGNRLFRRQTDIETLEAIKAAQVPLPSGYNPEVPPELDEICLIALGRNAETRYQDAAELQRALGDFMLPSTPDRIQPEFSRFLRERFGEEILQERERLDRGTQHASDLHYGGDADLDLDLELGEDPAEPNAEVTPAVTTETVRPSPGRQPFNRLVAVALLLVLGLAVSLAVLAWPLVFPAASDAELQVTVLPEQVTGAVLLVDGRQQESLSARLLPDQPHRVEIQAPGWQSRTKEIELVAGQVYSIEVQLQEETLEDLPAALEFELEMEDLETPTPAQVEARPTPTPRARTTPAPSLGDSPPDLPVADEPGRVRFSSDPSGAEVRIDGRRVGTTPLDWTDGRAGRSYNVEFSAPDRESSRAVVTGPAAGRTVTVKRTLPPVAAASAGKLNVQATPGWAKVFVDEAYVGTTPLIGHELSPGSHTIRLVNDRLGTDISDQVTIEAGETTIKAYQLDR